MRFLLLLFPALLFADPVVTATVIQFGGDYQYTYDISGTWSGVDYLNGLSLLVSPRTTGQSISTPDNLPDGVQVPDGWQTLSDTTTTPYYRPEWYGGVWFFGSPDEPAITLDGSTHATVSFLTGKAPINSWYALEGISIDGAIWFGEIAVPGYDDPGAENAIPEPSGWLLLITIVAVLRARVTTRFGATD